MITLLHYNFKSIFSLLYNFYLLLLPIELCFSPVFVSLLLFQIHKWSPNISNRCHRHFNRGLAFHCLVIGIFHGLHSTTSLTVLKPVLCFHMTSFNYGAKGVRDVDLTCSCHQSYIIPDSIFSANIAQCVTGVHRVQTCCCCAFFCLSVYKYVCACLVYVCVQCCI